MGKVTAPLWSFADNCRMEDFIRKRKKWPGLIRYFPGRTAGAIEAKYFAIKTKMGSHECNSVKKQDSTFQDAMSRAHAERRRQERSA